MMSCKNNPIVAAHNICVKINKRIVLDGVSVNFRKGIITGLVGPNGCGKSTLLKTVTGEIAPTSGCVSLQSKPLQNWPLKEKAKLMASLPQHPVAPDGVLVKDLVSLGRTAHKKWHEKLKLGDWSIIAHALSQVGLSDFQERYVSALSGGERQRAWIAMCLAQQANLLILDEPTSYLDLGHQLGVMDLLARLNKQSNLTIICVLHELSQAVQYCDELIIMQSGGVVAQGPPQDILTEKRLTNVFSVKGRIKDVDGTFYCLAMPNDSILGPSA